MGYIRIIYKEMLKKKDAAHRIFTKVCHREGAAWYFKGILCSFVLSRIALLFEYFYYQGKAKRINFLKDKDFIN